MREISRRPLVATLFLLAAAALPASARAADPTAEEDPVCTCRDELDRLLELVEGTYPGHRLEIAPDAERRAAYAKRVESVRRAVADAPRERCFRELRRFTDSFGDPHLFVTQIGPRRDSVPWPSAAPLEAPERHPGSPEELTRRAEAASAAGDPLSGIWYTAGGERLAVVPAEDAGDERVAVVLESAAEGWSPGDVRARFRTGADGGIEGVVYTDDRSPRQAAPEIARGDLLAMPPVTWGRVSAAGAGVLDPENPRAPVLSFPADEAVLLSLPSHSPEHRPKLEFLLGGHLRELLSRRLLIVDLRGNEGGSSSTTFPLEPLIVTTDGDSLLEWEGEPVVMASPENRQYFERMAEQGWVPRGLVRRIEAHPGELVPFEDPPAEGEAGEGESADTANAAEAAPIPHPPRPERVAILVDELSVSAAEAFLLRVGGSEKVTIFGRPTGGAIDYQNINMVRLACDGSGIVFGYPTLIASDRLPAGGVNPTGVVPDVAIDLPPAAWVPFVLDWYAER
jgi:hypothetical protein